MNRLVERGEQISAKSSHFPVQSQLSKTPHRSSSQARKQLGQQIYAALQDAKDLSPEKCLSTIKDRLIAIQISCKAIHKTFIVVEEQITCADYDLRGSQQDTATLFRGPSEDASVAICVTQKGSLLHRNGYIWNIYKNVGDVNPIENL